MTYYFAGVVWWGLVEYMQLITENTKLQQVFSEWNKGGLLSFLVEILPIIWHQG